MLSMALLMLLMVGNLQAASSSSSAGAVGPESEETRIIDLPEGFVGFALADGGVGSVGGGFDIQTCTALVSVLVHTNPDEDTEKNMRHLAMLHQSLKRRLLTDKVLTMKTGRDTKKNVEDVRNQVVGDFFVELMARGIPLQNITKEAKKLRVKGLLQFITIHAELKKNKRFSVYLEEPDADSENWLWKVGNFYRSIGLSSHLSRFRFSKQEGVWAILTSLLSSGRVTAQDAAEIYLGHTQATKKSDCPRVIVVDIAGKLQPFAQTYAEQKEERELLQREKEERELEAKRQEDERLAKEQKAQEEREQRAKAKADELEGCVESLELPTCKDRVLKLFEFWHMAAG